MRLFIFILIAAFSISGFASPLEWKVISDRAIKESQKPFLPIKNSRGEFLSRPTAASVTSGIYQQKTVHSNSKDKQIFSQRYWYLKNKPDTAPVLFYVCGEGACGDYVIRGILATHAAALGANMIALEHRYYGQSHPYKDLSTEHLKHLTVEYALKDVIRFQAYAKNTFGMKGKWIAVGGSYPGSLAAYLRTKYPRNFVGALASSAPVQADNDFSEYDRHVGQQAGPACVKAVQGVVAIADAAVTDPQKFADIKAKFGAEILENPDDFLYLLADTAAAAVQYGMKDDFCTQVTTSGLDGYAKASTMVAGVFGSLVSFSAQAAENIELSASSGNIGMRQWFYQSCTEFGFWQNVTPDPALQTRSLRINESYHRGICKRLFDLNDFADVAKINSVYFEPIQKKSSNILFTNGSEDPWLNLSITDINGNNTNPKNQAHLIMGAAHCDDLGRSAKSVSAQNLFVNLSKQWLVK